MMRRLSISLLLLAFVVACNPENKPSSDTPVAPQAISLSVSTWDAPQAGGSLELTVSAPSRPRFTLPEGVTLTDGTFKDYKITVTLTVTANNNYEVRSGEVVIASTGVPSVTLPLSQAGLQKPVVPESGKDAAGWENAASAALNMGTGWNLGNTLESNSGDVDHMWLEAWSDRSPSAYETAWGQPVTTRALIHMFKEAGFGAIRVPVTWYPHMGTITVDGDGHWDMSTWTGYDVDPVWMARVKEVVDYVMDEGLYCVLNVHHDTGDASTAWLRADEAIYVASRERFCALWQQIATTFADYGEKLLFESFNEMLDAQGTWNYSTAQAHEVINRYNADFVATVRATGGNNEHRNLVLNTYCAGSLPQVLGAYRLPEDKIEGHLLAEVHSYAPYLFAFDVEASQAKTVFDDWCAREVKAQIDNVYEYLVSKGIPCIIGEYGCTSARADGEIAKQLACYISHAAQYGIPCFCWMLLSDGADRSVPTWTKPSLKDAIIQAYNESLP